MLRRLAHNVLESGRTLGYALTAGLADLDQRPETVIGPNRDYSKFVILAHRRSGSSMLIGTLRSHPQIVGFGELFNKTRISFNVEGFDNFSRKLLYLREKYPVEFVERYVLGSYSEHVRAVGFKLFPDVIDNGHFQCLWQWLERRRDIKVIMLRRADLLATYTSLLMAKATGFYVIRSEADRPQTTVRIDPAQCQAEFERRRTYYQRAMEAVQSHEVLDLTYEELTSDLDAKLAQIQRFIGVDVRPLEVSSVKKEVRPLCEVIENYHQLQKHFAGTEWETHFATRR